MKLLFIHYVSQEARVVFDSSLFGDQWLDMFFVEIFKIYFCKFVFKFKRRSAFNFLKVTNPGKKIITVTAR